MVVFATEVAVIVAVVETEMLVGAVYTTEVVVLPLSAPTPVRLQVTPWLLVSLVSVAVMVAVCPGFSDVSGVDSVTAMVLLPEQPAKTSAQTRIPSASNERSLNFLTVSPLKVVTISLRNSKPLEGE
jgi:hypothetical protein